MIRLILILLVFMNPFTSLHGQKERKLVREGVKEYQNEKFSEAEVQFRKALDAKPGLYEADYNIANSLYKQKKFEEAANEYNKLIQRNNDPQQKADLYHNLGNSHLMAQKYQEGIEDYKNALRIRPEDEDTRYNLAYALAKMKEQQQQKNDQNKDNQNQDQDQKNSDQKEDQDQQDQKDKEKEEQQQNMQKDKKGDQKEQQQNTPAEKINQQEAEQMLNAVQNQEKEVKEKVDKKKAVARPVRTEKDW